MEIKEIKIDTPKGLELLLLLKKYSLVRIMWSVAL